MKLYFYNLQVKNLFKFLIPFLLTISCNPAKVKNNICTDFGNAKNNYVIKTIYNSNRIEYVDSHFCYSELHSVNDTLFVHLFNKMDFATNLKLNFSLNDKKLLSINTSERGDVRDTLEYQEFNRGVVKLFENYFYFNISKEIYNVTLNYKGIIKCNLPAIDSCYTIGSL